MCRMSFYDGVRMCVREGVKIGGGFVSLARLGVRNLRLVLCLLDVLSALG